MRKTWAAYLFFLSAIVLFFSPMLFFGQGFYYGDYKQQFYPWAHELYQSIRHFSLPLWTSQIGCGFPLLAEGQVGALYPLHWLLYLTLPFDIAYNASFLILFIVSGLFLMIYCRKQCEMEILPAVFTALCYLFGSAYAGMVFGAASLRTLVFLMPMLYFTSRLAEKGKRRHEAGLAVSTGLACLGGYPQMVLYMILACSLIALMHKRRLLRFAFSILLGVALGACQWLPTAELIMQSSRSSSDIDFALQRSFNPAGILGLLWPGFGAITGADLYVGVLPLALAIFALIYGRKRKMVVTAGVLSIIFILLALGRFNPLYKFFIEATQLFFLRNPSKYLVFAVFFLSVLAGVGLDILIKEGREAQARFAKLLAALFALAAVFYAASHFFVRAARKDILQWAENFVREHVWGRSGHPYSLDEYLRRLPDLMDNLISRTSFQEPHFLQMLLIWTISVTGVLLIGFFFSKKMNLLVAFILFASVWDLYQFSFYGSGFRGNFLNKNVFAQDAITMRLAEEPKPFRTYEWAPAYPGEAPATIANTNMIYGYDSVGLYSPLAAHRYREHLKDLGAVDNSSGTYPISKEKLLENMPLLKEMNVRFVVSREALEGVAGLERMDVAGQDKLYRVSESGPRAFMKEGEGEVTVLELGPGKARFDVNVEAQGRFFWSEIFYPGWKARVDGQPALIERSDEVFQSLSLSQGQHDVEFDFDPWSFRFGCAVSLLTLLGLVYFMRRK